MQLVRRKTAADEGGNNRHKSAHRKWNNGISEVQSGNKIRVAKTLPYLM